MPIAVGVVSPGKTTVAAGTPLVSVSVNGERVAQRWLLPRSLSPVAGSGSRAWMAVRSESKPSEVSVRPLGSDSARASDALIELPFAAASVSWSEDTRGGWLFFGGSVEGSETLAAFVQGSDGWTLHAVVPAHLSSPQYDGLSDTVIVGEWRFARGKEPSLINVPLFAGLSGARVIPDVVAISSDLSIATAYRAAWSSRDGGRSWNPMTVPWSESNASSVQRVRGEAGRALFSWRDDDGSTAIAEWNGEWKTLVVIPRSTPIASSIVWTEAGILAVISCQRAESHVDSVRLIIVVGDQPQEKEIRVSEGLLGSETCH